WCANQRLREQEPLPLTTRHIGQGARGKVTSADRVKRLLDHAAVVLTDRGQAPALAVERARNEIASAHAQGRQDCTQLRQIADRRIAAMGCATEDLHGASLSREQTKDGAHQCCLAGAVGPQHADELAGFDAKAHVGQHPAVADAQRDVIERNDAHEFGPVSALSSASSSPSTQSWNETFGGIVSVTPTTGTLDLAATSRSRSVSFSDTWLL